MMASPSYALFGVCSDTMFWSGALLDTRQRRELARYGFRPGLPFIWINESPSSEARGCLIESDFNPSAGHAFSPYEYNIDDIGSVREGLSLVGGALDAFSTAPWMDINQVSVGKPVTIHSKKVEDVSQTAQVGFRIHVAVTGTTIATLLSIFLCCAVGCIVERRRWRALRSGCVRHFVVASAGGPAAALRAVSSALILIISQLVSHSRIVLPMAPRPAFGKTSRVELSAYRLWWVVVQALKEYTGKPLPSYFASLVVAARRAVMLFASARIASFLDGIKRCSTVPDENALVIEVGEMAAFGSVTPKFDSRDEGYYKPASVVPSPSDFATVSSKDVKTKVVLPKLPVPPDVRESKAPGLKSILKTAKCGALSQKAPLRVHWCESLKNKDPVVRTEMAPLLARWFRPWRASSSSCPVVGNRPRAYASDEGDVIAAGLGFPSSSVVRGNRPRAYALDEEDLVSQAFYV